ncbi:MAG: hypothetical protein RJQ14_22800 [Marinoscillum sp.]
MQIRNWTIFTVLLMIVAGCYDSGLDATNTITENRINYNFDSFDEAAQPNDPFRVVGVTPNGAHWKVIVEYSGGCNEHSFYTWAAPDLFTQQPLHVGFVLSHDRNGDTCEALIRDTLNLDMREVVGADFVNASVSMINARSKTVINVDASLAQLTQSGNCALEASVELNDACNLSIWGDKWFLLKDSIGSKGKAWIIPVKNDAGVSLDAPQSGNYTIGITLLFGHNSSVTGNSCYVFDDALAVPAQINCLTRQ